MLIKVIPKRLTCTGWLLVWFCVSVVWLFHVCFHFLFSYLIASVSLFHTVVGRKLATKLIQFVLHRFAQIFTVRCLPEGARTFSQASRGCCAYIVQGLSMFKRENLRDKTRKNTKYSKLLLFSMFQSFFFIRELYSVDHMFLYLTFHLVYFFTFLTQWSYFKK